jgi:hypothetical protein
MDQTRAVSIDVGLKNLSYCVMEIIAGESRAGSGSRGPRFRVTGWGVVDIVGGGSRRSGNDTVAACIAALQQIPHCESVLVENQPGLKNPLMKAVQACVQTFFTLKGCRVTVCSPRKKTASAIAYLGSRDPAAQAAVKRMGLDSRRAEKAYTVAATAYALASLGHPHGGGVRAEAPAPPPDGPSPPDLEFSPEAAASFLAAAKKDDMADSLWQGLAYGGGGA